MPEVQAEAVTALARSYACSTRSEEMCYWCHQSKARAPAGPKVTLGSMALSSGSAPASGGGVSSQRTTASPRLRP